MQQVGLTGAVAPGASLEVRPSVAGRQPGHEDPDIQTCIEKNGWTALLDSPHAQHFRQHCSLCNRWIKDPTALKRHLTPLPLRSRLSVLRLSNNSPETVPAHGAKELRIAGTIISAM